MKTWMKGESDEHVRILIFQVVSNLVYTACKDYKQGLKKNTTESRNARGKGLASPPMVNSRKVLSGTGASANTSFMQGPKESKASKDFLSGTISPPIGEPEHLSNTIKPTNTIFNTQHLRSSSRGQQEIQHVAHFQFIDLSKLATSVNLASFAGTFCSMATTSRNQAEALFDFIDKFLILISTLKSREIKDRAADLMFKCKIFHKCLFYMHKRLPLLRQ